MIYFDNLGAIIKEKKYYGFPEKSASGSIVTFPDGIGGVPFKEVISNIDYNANGYSKMHVYNSNETQPQNNIVTITAVQEGTGAPSPSNIRPILAGLTFEMDDSSIMSVYGGTLNISSGVLTVNTERKTYDGDEDWSTNSSGNGVYIHKENRFSAIISCSKYLRVNNTAGSQLGNNCIAFNNNATNILVKDPDAMTAEAFTSALESVNMAILFQLGTAIVYNLSETELARACDALGIDAHVVEFPTGVTIYGGSLNVTTGVLTSNKAADGSDITPEYYQLPPVEIEELQGTNNIWSDAGDVSIIYRHKENKIDLLFTSGTAGTETYTAPESGKYLFVVTASNQGTKDIILPQGVTADAEFELDFASGNDGGIIAAVVDLTAGDVVTMSNTISSWVHNSKSVFKLTGIYISAVVDSVFQVDNSINYTPTGTGAALIVAACGGRAQSSNNEYDYTVPEPGNVLFASYINTNTFLRVVYCDLADALTIAMRGYDGGFAAAAVLQ